MKRNIWIAVWMSSVNFSIIFALVSSKINYSKVSFIRRGEPEYIDTEDSYEEEIDYVNVTYSKIVDSMLSLSKLNPETTSLIKLGKSPASIDILALIVQKPNYNPKFSNTILLAAGFHENDWQSIFTVFYTAKTLIEYKENVKIMFGINTKWIIIPILNPDLYTNTFQGAVQNDSKSAKNDNWYKNYYGNFLYKVKEENVGIIIHLRSEKACSTNYSKFLQFDELNAKGNKKNNLAKALQKESYLICNIIIQEPIVNNNTNTSITENETFEEWMSKNVENYHSVIILSLTVLNTAQPQYRNTVELRTVLTIVQIIKKIKMFFSQTYYTIVDNYRNEIDNFLRGRFPHEAHYHHGTGTKIIVCQILLPLQLFILYILNEIKV